MNAIDNDLHNVMSAIGQRARGAAATLAFASTDAKNLALTAAADAILAERETILAANVEDRAAAKERGIAPAFLDRLALSDGRRARVLVISASTVVMSPSNAFVPVSTRYMIAARDQRSVRGSRSRSQRTYSGLM